MKPVKDGATCPTCGATVKVIGKTTMHYEPVISDHLFEELVEALKNVINNYEQCLNNDKIYINPESNHSINIAKQALSKAEEVCHE